MQLISKEAAIEELQSIANTIKGVGKWERYFEGLKLGYLSAAKALDRLPTEENRTTLVNHYWIVFFSSCCSLFYRKHSKLLRGK